jgi:hypothetical protein
MSICDLFFTDCAFSAAIWGEHPIYVRAAVPYLNNRTITLSSLARQRGPSVATISNESGTALNAPLVNASTVGPRMIYPVGAAALVAVMLGMNQRRLGCP